MSIHKLIREGRERLKLTEQEFADACGVTRGAVQHWEREDGTAPRRSNQELVAAVLGITVAELMGSGSRSDEGVAQSVSLQRLTVVSTLKWDDLMTSKLPPVFKVELLDNSMAPRAPAGTLIELTVALEPKPGDGVLIRDKEGHHYFREYRQKRPGAWEAHAHNEAYRPLDSKEDGLRIIAVLTGVSTRWAL